MSEKLLQAKQACGHGEWLGWLGANCNLKERQARKYIKLAEGFPQLSNRQSTADFTGIESAIAYLSAPDEVKAQVVPNSASVQKHALRSF